MPRHGLFACVLAEAIGTFILVFLGCGVVHTAVLTGAQSGLWQVAVVWGAAVTLAIYTVASVSGAHINPAMTAAFALWRGFPWQRVPAYWLGQVAGAALAAGILFLLFGPYLAEREKVKGVVRGGPGSDVTAMCYGEYFPNPGMCGDGSKPYIAAERDEYDRLVPEVSAFAAEFVATMLLALIVFGVTEHRSHAAPKSGMAPAFIGLTVAALISVIAPLTQACFNPARDFGPRLVAYYAGWGEIAIPGPRGGFFIVYILAPTLGALVGGGIYQLLIRPSLPAAPPETT